MHCFAKNVIVPTLGKRLICVIVPLLIEIIVKVMTERLCGLADISVNVGKVFRMCPILKLKEECKITRLVKEDNLIKIFKPDLNADKRNLLHLNLI